MSDWTHGFKHAGILSGKASEGGRKHIGILFEKAIVIASLKKPGGSFSITRNLAVIIAKLY
jgi:hypothetical protein